VTTRLTVAFVSAAIFLAASPPSVQAVTPPAPTYACSPPAIATAASCDSWHTGPVTLKWQWDNFSSTPDNTDGNSCADRTFTDDTAATSVTCRVLSNDDQTPNQTTATVHVDQTAPDITAAIPDRPPDFNGWWNHPIAFTFTETDATSGPAGCETASVSGAQSAVLGTCRDNAGNVASRAFPVAYDAKPPSITRVHATPGNKQAGLEWSTSPDVTRTDVTRSPGVGTAPSTLVYSGSGKSFVDTGVDNGTRYRYTVVAFDQAGNTASATGSARPEPWIGLLPPHGSKFKSLPVLHWPRVAGASYYNVQLYRGKRKVYTTWPNRNKLRLRRVVRFKGRPISLGRGGYRWYVWPGIGARSAHNYGDLAGQSTFRMLR
jgi:hypothetical protein